MRNITVAGLAAAIALFAVGGATGAKSSPKATVAIQILNVSDWHGNVDPVANIGGAWNISARWQQERAAGPTLTLTGGDDFGASPALVNFFDDEPAIKAERLMGIQVGTFGNHNFDKGIDHLKKLVALAKAPTSQAAPGTPFRYVAANLEDPATTQKVGASVGPKSKIVFRKTANAGKVQITVRDRSTKDNFHLIGPGVNKKTGVKFKGTVKWTVTLAIGTYTFRSDAHRKLHGTTKVDQRGALGGAIDRMRIFNVGGADVAVIGIVNEEAPSLVLPGSFGTLKVSDGVVAANKWAAIARSRGADVVVVVTHKGVRAMSNGQPIGELVDFANKVKGVDVILGDHTDVQYSGTINGALVYENRSFGVTYAKAQLTVDTGTASKRGSVLSKSVAFVSPAAGALTDNNTKCPAAPAFCDQAIVDMLVPYRVQLASKLDEKIATTTEPYDRGGNLERTQELPIGDLIADSLRARYRTQLGFMNSGGIRSQVPACSYQPTNKSLNRANWNAAHTAVTTCAGYGSGTPYDIVLGDIFTVLPFGNIITTRTVTGAQLWAALENGVSKFAADGTNTQGRFPQISGFKFTFRYTVPSGCSGSEVAPVTWTCTPSRVTTVTLDDGTPVPNSSASTYSVALPNFVSSGGDSFFMFNDGQGATQELDALVLQAYLVANPVQDPKSKPLNRITKLP
jgi:2',3'-cyclic-nucleotide 2'-phosphodiesterase (5'-nucleotidase family)